MADRISKVKRRANMSSRVALKLNEADSLLKAYGLRRTFTRITLLQCLARQAGPASHAEIGLALSSHGFDPSTIFRGLNDLVAAGLVTRIDIGDRIWRFELADLVLTGTECLQHPHIVCRNCGRIECLRNDSTSKLKLAIPHWQIEDVIFKGLCRGCRESP